VLELAQGDWPGKAIALEMVEPVRRVPISEEVVNVARRYVRERLVSENLRGMRCISPLPACTSSTFS
jgi:hypothetical protein